MSNKNYNTAARLLHHLALSHPAIAKASFEIEQQFMGNTGFEHCSDRHVFISGLARAGTTLLLRWFYASGRYRSLNYRDMPLPLMPSIWSRLSSPFHSSLSPQERAHSDRLMVDEESPEAIEEVFWRVLAGDQYLMPERLITMEADAELREQFVQYVAALIRSNGQEKTLYLSKNNNNILRLPSIRKCFPKALIIIPFRNPLSQASSLQRVHRHFLQMHSSDAFSRSYMTWLGHHEFGAEHRPMIFSTEMQRRLASYSVSSLNYWLVLWAHTYRYLLSDATPADVVYVGYDNFCSNADEVWKIIAGIADLPSSINHADAIVAASEPAMPDNIDSVCLNEANDVFQELLQREAACLEEKIDF